MATQAQAQTSAKYLNGVLTRFRKLGPQLLDLMHRAAEISAQARQDGDTARYETAQETLMRLRDVRATWIRLSTQVDRYVDLVPGLGAIPVVPIAYAAAIVALAGSVAAILRKSTAEEAVIKQLEKGSITPEEATELVRHIEGGGKPPGVLGDIPQWVGLGVLGWFALKAWEAR